ncbi:MAG: hypothetical protein ABSA68_13340 [Xanthobacteraceae bacterium]|jgi:hypothetical protein
MRTGPPHTYGWLKVGTADKLNLWETPTGYCLYLDKAAWLQQDETGFITSIEPPATPPRCSAVPKAAGLH